MSKKDDDFTVGSNLFTNKEFEQRRKKGLTLSRMKSFYKAVDISDQVDDEEKMRLRESRAIRKRFRILVVGNTVAYCNRMKLMLNENDFVSVETTIDGYEALSLLQGDKKYNLVISAYRVNRFDGRKIYDFINDHIKHSVSFIMIDNLSVQECNNIKDHGILVVPGKFDEVKNMSVIWAFYVHFLKVFERSHLSIV